MRACRLMRGCVAAALSLLSFATLAATYWKGGDGRWNDPDMWNGGVPDATTEVRFSGDGTITLDGDCVCGQLNLSGNLTFVRPAGGGASSLTAAASYLSCELYGTMVVDGPDVTFPSYSYIRGALKLRNGSLTSVGDMTALSAAARFEISGGTFTAQRLNLGGVGETVYVQTGGIVSVTQFETVSGNVISVTGGVLVRRDANLAVPVGYVDFGNATNVVAGVTFSKDATSAAPADYYGPALILGGAGIVQSGKYAGFPHGILLGAFSNWACNTRETYIVREQVAFDTADYFTPTTKRTISVRNFGMEDRTVFSAFGGGTVSFPSEFSPFPDFLASFSVGDDTSIGLEPYPWGGSLYNKNSKIVAVSISFGDGSRTTFMADYDRFLALEKITFGDGAKFTVTASKKLTAATWYVLFDAGPRTDLPNNLDITLDDVTYASYVGADAFSGWTVTNVANVAWLDDGKIDMSPSTGDTTEWCGGSGNLLSTDANWSCGSCQSPLTSGNRNIKFKTLAGEVENDVDGLNFNILNLGATCGPLVMSGKPILFSHPGSASSGSSIVNDGIFPIVFRNEVKAKSDVSTVGITLRKGYGAFMGGLDMANVQFGISGRTHIGCAARVKDLYMNAPYWAGGGDLNTELVVLNGGVMTVSAQETAFAQSGNSTLRVLDGGTLAFVGGEFKNQVPVTHTVFGHLDIGVPLSTTATLGFFGSGRMEIASTKSTDTAAVVQIGEKLRLYPGSWSTVTADGAGPVTLKVVTHATLGATNSWTYGVADGVATATTAASRALVVAKHETLTVNTQSPDDATAHAVIFDDPISASGAFLVKDGAGSLVLASADNDLATAGVTVNEGALVCRVAQTFGTLTAGVGATLTADAAAGSLAAITVNGDATLDGAMIDLTKAARAAAQVWTPVLTVPSGKKIVGSPVAGADMRVKIVSNGDGSMSLCCKANAGLMIIVK